MKNFTKFRKLATLTKLQSIIALPRPVETLWTIGFGLDSMFLFCSCEAMNKAKAPRDIAMDDQLRSFLAHLSNENGAEPKPQQAKPQEQMADEEVQQALAICNGDAIAALRITLIANAFLEAQVEELKTQISAGFPRKRNPARSKVSEIPTRAKKSARAAKA